MGFSDLCFWPMETNEMVDIMLQLWNGIWGDRATPRVVEGTTCTAIGVELSH